MYSASLATKHYRQKMQEQMTQPVRQPWRGLTEDSFKNHLHDSNEYKQPQSEVNGS